MKGLVVLGATGKISLNVLSYCFGEKTFDKYFLYARNVDKLKKLEVGNSEADCTVYDMESGVDIASVSLEEKFKDFDELTLLMLAFTIEPIKSIGSFETDEIRKNINVNIFSQISFIDYYCHIAHKNNISLKIIFIDSGAAYAPIKGWSLYCSAKAYMSMYLQCLEKEHDVSVVLFEPGVIDTPMQEKIRESDPKVFDRVDEFREYKEKGVLRKPEVIAEQIFRRYLREWTAVGVKERVEI